MRLLHVAGAALLLAGCEEASSQQPPAALTVTAAAVAEVAAPTAVESPGSEHEEGTSDSTDVANAKFVSRFLGEDDSERRRSLRKQPIVEIERGRGGRSLAFKLTLEDGTQGYYKPEQTFSGAHWYAELMAYYLDRELGFGRVPPVVGRQVEWALLKPYAKGDRRLKEVIIQEDGSVRGAFIWWLSKKPTRLTTGRNWERWVRVNGPLRISPYQRPIDWRKDRKSGEASEQHWPVARAPDTPSRPSELSDMILFDYLCTNVDRWGGENENVRTHGKGGPLLFFDNGAGFSPGRARISLMDSRLHALERFLPATRGKIDALDLDSLSKRMQTDPLYPFLPERSWQGIKTRLEHAREHLQSLHARFGDMAHLPTEPP